MTTQTDSTRPIPERGFTQQEFADRCQRVQHAMNEQGINLVLLTTPGDIFYFTGFLTQFWQSPTRPWFVLIPSSGKPVAVIPSIGVVCMQRTWVDDIRSWSSPHESDDGVGLLCSTMRELAGNKPCIGLPMGPGSHLRMPLNSLDEMRKSLSEAQWINASRLIESIREIKSEAEINKIRHICTIASNAFELVPDFKLEGLTEIELFKQFKMQCLELGADDCQYLVGGSGQHGYGDVISPAGNRRLKNGDVFMLDTGCVWDGYHCDFDRNFAVGSASTEANEAYAQLWHATEAAIDVIKPGMTCSDVFDVMMKAMPDADGGSVGRIGHGLGIDLTEPPSLTNFDHTPLRAGMVMTLEPGLNYGDGLTMVHEENLVIRDTGAELLSRRAPEYLPVCSNTKPN